MSYICSQCGAEENHEHRINCYFEGQRVQNPAKVIEDKLWEFICEGGADGDYIRELAAEIAKELGL